MDRYFSKKHSRLALLLCLLVAYSGIASAFFTTVVGEHAMHEAKVGSMNHDHALPQATDTSNEELTASGSHGVAHDCCDDENEGCSTSHIACLTHCSAAAIDHFWRSIDSEPACIHAVTVRKSTPSVNSNRPFKPPR